MKQAVLKIALKVEELLKYEGHEAKIHGARVMTGDCIIVLYEEKVISPEQFKEAMEEIDRIYPVK